MGVMSLTFSRLAVNARSQATWRVRVMSLLFVYLSGVCAFSLTTALCVCPLRVRGPGKSYVGSSWGKPARCRPLVQLCRVNASLSFAVGWRFLPVKCLSGSLAVGRAVYHSLLSYMRRGVRGGDVGAVGFFVVLVIWISGLPSVVWFSPLADSLGGSWPGPSWCMAIIVT